MVGASDRRSRETMRRDGRSCWVHWGIPLGSAGPGGALPGLWVRTRDEKGTKQLAKEREAKHGRAPGGRGSLLREAGILALILVALALLWVLINFLF